MGFITSMQDWFNIPKLIISPQYQEIKEEFYDCLSRYKKAFDKIQLTFMIFKKSTLFSS